MKLIKKPLAKKFKLARAKKKASKRKLVKKNTWRRRLRAWNLRLDRRRQQRTAVVVSKDDTVRTCSNCGEVYKGRLCPQCGQAGTWSRYTLKQAFLNLLDIWGLGNRPMFRTVRELFYRPGYMIRDYLNGHRNFYFPPFKLLAVMIVLLFVANKLAGVEQGDMLKSLVEFDLSKININDTETSVALSSYMLSVGHAFQLFARFMASNMIYEWLFIAIFAGVSIWISFRHLSRYTFIETYIFSIFVLSQKMICDIPKALGKVVGDLIEKQALLHSASGEVTLIGGIWTFFLLISGLIATCYALMVLYLIVLDFRQFYGLKWKTTIKHLINSAIIMMLLIVWVVSLLAAILLIEKTVYVWLGLLLLLLLPASFVLADRYLTRNWPIVPLMVSRLCKISMLSVLISIPLGFYMYGNDVNILMACGLTLLFFVLAVTLSLLPVAVHKKYHRSWLSLLSLLPILVLAIVTIKVFILMDY